MKKLYLMIAILMGIALLGCGGSSNGTKEETQVVPATMSNTDIILDEAFKNKREGLQVKGSGKIIKLLADDTIGSRHQKFILELASNQTLLISHNIDIAPKIVTLKVNDTVEFNGEYLYNVKGGLVHWTHKDPNGNHENGWLNHNGMLYQ